MKFLKFVINCSDEEIVKRDNHGFYVFVKMPFHHRLFLLFWGKMLIRITNHRNLEFIKQQDNGIN